MRINIGDTKMEYREVAMRTLIVIPLSILFVTFSGGGHPSTPVVFAVPALVLFGPLLFLFPAGGIPSVIFSIFGAYPLYLAYGLIFAFLSGTRPVACRTFLVAAMLFQIGTGVVFLLIFY